MSEAAVKRYKELVERRRKGNLSEEEEDDLLVGMDTLWWNMTEKERDEMDQNQRRIYKFPITDSPGYQNILMPDSPVFAAGNAEVLSIGHSPQGGLCVWADVLPGPDRERVLYLAVTGGPPPDVDARFVGTVNDRGYVAHCWDCGWKKL